jgi:hypothetical protein
MNTDLGVLKGCVTFHLGERVLLSQEIWLQSDKLYAWAQRVMDFVLKPAQDDTHRLEVWWGIDSPEINLIIRRTDVSSYEVMDPYLAQTLQPTYELLCIIDSGNFSGKNEIEFEGPALFMLPDGQQLYAFAHDLRSEAEIAMLLGDSEQGHNG